jgi:hypothetical protein
MKQDSLTNEVTGAVVTGLSPRSAEFSPRSVHAGFVAGKVVLRQVFLRGLWFSPVVTFHRCSPYLEIKNIPVGGRSSET